MPSLRRYQIWLLALLLAGLALGLRVYHFEPPHVDEATAFTRSSLPPGLHSDEAFNVLGAIHAIRTYDFQPFIQIDLGRLPAHIYLTALIFAFTGPLLIGGRLAALLAGVIGLLLVGPAVAQCFQTTLAAVERRVLAWIAVGQMAVTYWFVHFSRLGMEHTTLVMFALLALWALFWALHRPDRWRASVAGGLLGTALYAYPAAYFMPIAVGLVLLHYWLTQRVFRATALRFCLFYGMGFVLCALPLGWFAWQHPAAFFMRPGGVAAHNSAQWLTNAWLAVGGLFWRGDLNVAYNVPGRPFLDSLQIVLFAIGFLTCLYRFREPGYALGPLWLVVMLVPQVLTDAPQFARISGATPGILLIVAIGGFVLWQQMVRVSRSRGWATIGLIGLTLCSAALTAHAYFVEWPQSSDIWRTFRVAERMEAELSTQFSPDVRVYLSPIDRHFSTVEAVLLDTDRSQAGKLQVVSFNGRVCTVMPPAGQSAVYLLTDYEDQATPQRLAAVYGSEFISQSFRIQDRTYVQQIKIPASTKIRLPAQSQPVRAGQIGHLVEPMAITVPLQVRAGDQLPVSLFWQIIGQTTKDYTLSVYLLGPTTPSAPAKLWSQVDAQPCMNTYPTSVWQKGEHILAERVLYLPPDLPPGHYVVGIDLYDLATMTRLPAYNAQGQPAGDTLTMAFIDVATP